MSSPHTPKQNHLLDALPAADYARLLPDLELIPMPLGWAVYESGGHSGYLSEIAIIGNEGLATMPLVAVEPGPLARR